MAELQQTRYDRLVRRVGAIIGTGSMVGEALSELFPVLDLENLPPELYILNDNRLAVGAEDRGAAGAGNFNQIQLYNPLGSRAIITVTQFLVSSNGTQTVAFGATLTAATNNITNKQFRDTRFRVTDQPLGQIRHDVAVAVTPNVGLVRIAANTERSIRDDTGIYVLAPGSGFQVSNGAANTELFVTFFWHERAAETSELPPITGNAIIA